MDSIRIENKFPELSSKCTSNTNCPILYVRPYMSSQKPTIFLVLGPSGVGKDTLMTGASKILSPNEFVFLKRVITRNKNSGGEDHYAVSEEEFSKRALLGDFALQWQAHGLKYGIPKDALFNAIIQGKNCIVNISRTAVEEAQRKLLPYCNVIVIQIVASPTILKSRLLNRGRESLDEINQRIKRGEEMRALVEKTAYNLITITNDGTMEEGIKSFLKAVSNGIVTNGILSNGVSLKNHNLNSNNTKT